MWSRFLVLSLALPTPQLPSATLPSVMLDVIFWIVAAACIIAQWFILRAVWRVIPAASVAPSVPMPKRASEIAWAILPALLLAAAFVGAWRSMHPASPDFHPPSSHGAPVAPVARS